MKVAINGFGRIGRLVFRQMFDNPDVEIVAINDLTSAEMLAYLLKFDTAQGIYHNYLRTFHDENSITVCGKRIPIYAEPDAHNLPWGELGIDIVMECSGFYASKDKAMAHINAGAKKVVISSPAKGDLKTIVYGVNHETLTPDDVIVSGASCTTNCLAPMVDALNSHYTVISGIMTTIHAYTGDQVILDAPQRKGNLRRSRAGAENIVPSTTGAAEAISKVIPELAGKLTGSAQRVPVATGSTCILVANVMCPYNLEAHHINKVMEHYSNLIPETFGYNEEMIVSSDVVGMTFGSLFDATQTIVKRVDDETYQVQVVAWYDNEMSYACQMVRTAIYLASL